MAVRTEPNFHWIHDIYRVDQSGDMYLLQSATAVGLDNSNWVEKMEKSVGDKEKN